MNRNSSQKLDEATIKTLSLISYKKSYVVDEELMNKRSACDIVVVRGANMGEVSMRLSSVPGRLPTDPQVQQVPLIQQPAIQDHLH